MPSHASMRLPPFSPRWLPLTRLLRRWRAVRGDGAAVAEKPSETEIRQQLERVIASPAFETSQRNRRFLRYVVEETLAGRADRIKAYSVATVVFERDQDFDPQTDPIIRIEASRLRRALDHYYLAAGGEDAVRIAVPKGSYVPLFAYAHAPEAGIAATSRESGWQIVAAATAAAVRTPLSFRRPALVVTGLAAIVLAAMAGYVVPRSETGRASNGPAAASAQARRGPAIMVTPFTVADPASGSIADTLSREVAAAIALFPDLAVFAPGAPAPAGGADYRLAGYGDVVQGQLRLAVRLADARSQREIWSATFETPVDAIAPRAAFVGRIARALAGPRGAIFAEQAREIAVQPVASATPQQCVLRHRLYWSVPTAQRLADTRACLERAVKLDPGYSSAHAALAMAQLDPIRLRLVPQHEWQPYLDAALASARRAIDLAPNTPRAHLALHHAKWLSGELEQAFAAAERALALNPLDTEVLADLGIRRAARGDWKQALAMIETAYAEDHDLPSQYRQATSLHYYLTGQYEQALAEAKRIDLPGYNFVNVLQAIAHAKLGRHEQAAAAVARILAAEPQFAQTWAADLAARNLRDDIIRAIGEGLREAGLAATGVAGG